MTDIKPSLHVYHVQYLYHTLLFCVSDLWPWRGDLYLDFLLQNCLNETSHQWYICCILPISEISSKGSDLGSSLTHLSRSDRSSRSWTLLVSAILPQQNHINAKMVYLESFINISDEFRPLTYFSRSDRAVRLVCLSIQFLLAYIHDWHQTITVYLPCPVLVPHTIILALWPLTLAWWLWPLLCLLLQNYLNQTSYQYQNGTFAAFLKGSDLGGPLTHCKTCYNNAIWIKRHIHAKTECLVNLANILYKF